MKKFYLTLVILALSMLVTSCFPKKDVDRGRDGTRTDDEYDDKKNRDKDRRSVLDRSKDRYPGPTCEEKKEDDKKHPCVEDCREIYGRRGDRDDCEKLPVKQIEVLAGLYEELKDPDSDALDSVEAEDLEVYLNVSIESFDRLVKRYSEGDAKRLLVWVAEKEEITEVFEKEDDDFEVIRSLLNKLASFTDTNIYLPFTKNVESNDQLIEIAIIASNVPALTWFQGFILQESDCDDEAKDEEECLKQFCHIAKGMAEENRQDWLGFEIFEGFMEDVIEDNINGHASNFGLDSVKEKCWFKAVTGTDRNPAPIIINSVGDVSDFYVEICRKLVEGSGTPCK